MRVTFRLLGLAALFALLAGCGKSRSVVVPPLSAVSLSVAADTIAVDAIVQYSTTAYDLSGNPVANVPFSYRSTDIGVFTVNGAGRVTGVAEGEALLIVEAGGQRDTAQILVLPAEAGWFVQTSNSTRQLNDVFFRPNGRHGIVVGNSGEVLTTNDAGATWDRRTSGTLFNLNAVWFVSDSLGWAVGTNGTALKSTTGGRTWTLVTTGSSDALQDVFFANASNGWIVGSNGTVLKTVNGGTTWDKQNVTASTLNSVSFFGAHGWAVGNSGIIAGSHDYGDTWFIVQPAVTAQALRAVTRRSEPLAVAAGAQGSVPRTAAGPDSTAWQLVTTGAANDLEDLSFVSDLLGWAVGSNGGGIVLVTEDGGLSWLPQTAPSGNTLHGVWFIDSLRGWAVGDNGRILHTGTGGE